MLLDLRKLFGLDGQVAIVTGAAEGMGAAIARHLAGAGAKVALADINLALAEQTAADIRAEGGDARAYAVDMAQEASVVEVMARVRADFGGLTILVNNAGVQDREFLENTSVELWDRIHGINLRGPFLALREAAKVMRVDGAKGRIVNIASHSARHPILPGILAYAAAKTGVLGLTRNAALELVKDGITVNAVLPGNTTTAGQYRAPGPPIAPEVIATLTPPLGRTGTPDDIAAAVLYLVTPASAWVTGQSLVVDGGHLMS